MLRNIVIVLLSFGASAGFGLVFGIETKRLPLAGLCGAISRIVLITCQSFIPNRVAYLFLSALAAGLLADFLAKRTKTLSTMYLRNMMRSDAVSFPHPLPFDGTPDVV